MSIKCQVCGSEINYKREHVENSQVELTHREAQIFAFVIQGATNKEIAETLFVGQGAVKFHITSIFKKLGVTKRRPEAIFLWNSGMIDQRIVKLVYQFLPAERQKGILVGVKDE